MTSPVDKRCVTIFGAGVAGLTVAHELAVRGFDVEVWEPAPDPANPANVCAVGGMARTQYATVNDPVSPSSAIPARPDRALRLVPAPDVRIAFSPWSAELDGAAKWEIERFAVLLLSDDLRRFDVEIHGWPGSAGDRQLAQARADAVEKALVAAKVDKGRLTTYADGDVPGAGDRVDFVVRQKILPGEHGFRFFPAFYRHVFDTMKRTPLLTPVPRTAEETARHEAFVAKGRRDRGARRRLDVSFVETGRTAHDNLVATTSQALAFDDGIADVNVVSRRRTFSLEAIRLGLRAFLEQMSFTLEDLGKVYVKLLKYLTSCSERRAAEYEGRSWWDFIDGDSLSEGGQARLDAWPRALVAMSARQADARTQGNVIVQLLLDQILERDYTDGTLNAPTSEAWLEPWRTFLEQSQGVRFCRGTLDGFQPVRTDPAIILPIVTPPPGEEPPRSFAEGYYVIALPLPEAQRVARSLLEAGAAAYPEEPVTLRRLRDFPLGSVDRARPDGALQHMVGIQFFFEEDVQWVDGHIYFPDSEWELTAISQAKFWQRKHDFREGYYGTISVCISNLYAPSATTGKCAWELEADDIAEEVWRQISRALSGRVGASQGEFLASRGGLPTPIAYHLDDNLEGPPGANRQNLSPLLVNLPGAYQARPGSPSSGYELVYDCFVFAGTYMQTHTRLTTMEAANESGRHAVNAILSGSLSSAAVGPQRGNLCAIWDPEDNEIDDLEAFKEIDRRLQARGLPHFVDILDLDAPGAAAIAALDQVLDATWTGAGGSVTSRIARAIHHLTKLSLG